MNRIRNALLLVLLVSAAAWLLADTLMPQPFTYFAFRGKFVQFSGVMAIVAMSVAMVLALRPRRLEPALDGLDKIYRLHKWLGITALVAGIAHWWFAKGTKWMVGWGWLERPARGPRGPGPEPGTLEALLRSQRGLAESIGEWTFYVTAALIVIALVHRVPYHWFRKSHRFIAPAYVLLAFHAVVLVEWRYWTQPVGWLVALSLAGGIAAALVSIAGRIGAGHRVAGTIQALREYPALGVLESTIALSPDWPGHAAGQFAFVTSNPAEGAHPYTIASAWDPEQPRITFITKALGDHTSRLRETLSVGLPVTVEGPYGRFQFDDGPERQIWIGAGIGITPFVARMKQLARERHAARIDLFHPTAVFEQAAIDRMTADAQAAGVTLHVHADDHRAPRVDAARIRAVVPDWKDASVWFCGPAGYGQALRRDLVAAGLPAGRFHQELFAMR